MLRHGDRLASLHPRLHGAVEWIASVASFDIYVYEGERSLEKQAEYYARGRTTPGPRVTNAAPGDSAHNFRLAADIYPWVDGASVEDTSAPEWDELGRLIGQSGMIWGGLWTFVDKPHIELPSWRQWMNWDGKGAATTPGGWIALGVVLTLAIGAGLVYAAWRFAS